MAKFNHKFSLEDYNDTYRLYASEDIMASLDFISSSAVRVAVYSRDSYMLPSYCVDPDNQLAEIPRERLDTKGFELSCPDVLCLDDKEKITLKCGVEISVNLNNFLLEYHMGDDILLADRGPLAYNLENEFGGGSYHYLLRERGERVFGLGDKSGGVDKSGRDFKIEATDPMGYNAKSSDPLYKHIPFYICENSVGSYGIFYDTSDTSYINLGREHNNYYEPYKYFKTEDDCLVYYVFFGTKLDILKQFSRLCGKQAFPPKWSFDYCASTMAYTDAPDAENKMNEFLQRVKEEDLNCSAFYMSSGYTSIGKGRYVFNWNYDKFPNPEAFIKRFNDNGINLIPNIKPAFLCSHPMYDMLDKKGYFIKNPDGTPFVTQFWGGLGSYLDFTNKDAFDFWGEQVKDKLLDKGISATWNDNNEFDIKDTDALALGYGRGVVNASRIRPSLTYLMVQSSYKAQLEKQPDLRPFLSTRSGNIAVRRMAQTWSGDNNTSFEDLKYCHFIGLTMSLSGLYFYGHDLGGFSGEMPSRELLLRWLQHGVFEPRFTIHSWNSDGSATMPWSYPDIMDSVKEIFAQRKRLIPYLYNCAYKAVEYDEPMNAPLFLYYDDKDISLEAQSFMVGRDILATCVLDEGAESVKAYLPYGDCWYLGDKCYNGGQEVELNISPFGAVPYFVRGGSVLPTDEGEAGFNKQEKLVLTVYSLESGSFTSEFFTDDGVSFDYKSGKCARLEIMVECSSDEVIISINNKGDMAINPEIRLCSGDSRRLVII